MSLRVGLRVAKNALNKFHKIERQTIHPFTKSYADIRTPYNEKDNVFLEENISVKEPIHLLNLWFEEAKNNPNVIEPHAICVSTCTKDGKPSARMMLCKGHSKEGLILFTHYTSRKGIELEENPNIALTYFWAPLNKQVRVEGVAEKLPFSVADEYFKGRPYNSKIGALCSDQSKIVEGRHVITTKEKELKEKYATEVPRPPLWGGYLVKPHRIEFWQGQTDRIHDRICFRKVEPEEEIDERITHKGEDGWVYERLAP